MARIRGVEDREAGLLARLVFWLTRRRIGRVVQSVRITAHHTRILRGMGQMEMAQQAARRMDPALKELAQLKVALMIGCPF